MKEVVIYETSLPLVDEDSIVENLRVTRASDGSVKIRVIRAGTGEYPISIPKTLTSEEAERLGTALLGTHSGFEDLKERSEQAETVAKSRLQLRHSEGKTIELKRELRKCQERLWSQSSAASALDEIGFDEWPIAEQYVLSQMMARAAAHSGHGNVVGRTTRVLRGFITLMRGKI